MKHWTDDYVGIPFVSRGRGRAGADCWGLVRLVYAEQYGIDLPSLADVYAEAADTAQAAGALAAHREGWRQVDEPREGDVVLLRVDGAESHVGVWLDGSRMLHAREGHAACVERLDAGAWRHRVCGVFRYAPGVMVSGCPHPLQTRRIDGVMPEGATLREMVDAHGVAPELVRDGHAWVNGLPVPFEQWGNVRPLAGDRVEFRVVPQGGKGFLGSVLSIVVMAAAVWVSGGAAAGLLGSSFAAGTFGAAALGVGVSVAGMMLVNALVPVSMPKGAASGYTNAEQLYRLTGGRNEMRQFGSIPVVLGRFRFTPPQAAVSFTTAHGNNRYLNMLVCWGYGPLNVSGLRIGKTELASYDVADRAAPTYQDDYDRITKELGCPAGVVYTHRGADNNTETLRSIYAHDVEELQLGFEAKFEDGWSPAYQLNETDVTRLLVILKFPIGLYGKEMSKGRTVGRHCELDIEYRKVGASDWINMPGDTPHAVYLRDVRNEAPFSRVVEARDLPPGRYEVRFRRMDNERAWEGGEPTFNTCVIESVAAFATRDPFYPPAPMAMTALSVRATSQLNGNMEGLNGIVESVCLDWDGLRWIERATTNPAALFRHVLQHPGNAARVADEQIDLARLQYWHTWCARRGYSYETIMAGSRSVYDVLVEIAAAGRASVTQIDGRWSVVIDEPRSVAQHFTPHNSWGFEGVRILPRLPDAFRCRFQNRAKDYELDERIVYNDGHDETTASVFETLELPGVTDAAHVYKLARYHLAALKLRPEEYTLNVDIEHLVCTRGDRVRVTHDVPMWGLGSGRIKKLSGAGLGVVLDEAVPMEAGKQYTLRWRNSGGGSYAATVAAKPTDGHYDELSFVAPPESFWPQPGDLFMFGAIGAESADCVVKAIEPTGNMTARLVLVDYAPALFDIAQDDPDDGNYVPIPPWDSGITLPPTLDRETVTDKPGVAGVDSGTASLERDASGRVVPTVCVAWSNPRELDGRIDAVEVRWRYTGSAWASLGAVGVDDGSVRVRGVFEGDLIDVDARYVTRSGVGGDWVRFATAHEVVGKTEPPADVRWLAAAVSGVDVLLEWPAVPDIDVDGYEVRTGDSWDGAAVVGYTMAGALVLPGAARVGSTYYHVKAMDSGGRYSLAAASEVLDIAAHGAPAGLVAEHGATASALAWQDTAGGLDRRHYELRVGPTWDGAAVLDTATGTTYQLGTLPLGLRRYWVSAVDVSGHYGAPAAVDVEILLDVPGDLSATISGDALLFDWADGVSTYRLDRYEVLCGGELVANVKASQWSQRITWQGVRTYAVRPVNAAGQVGPSDALDVRIDPPGVPESLRAQVLDNNVLLTWQPSAAGSLPVAGYRVLRGSASLGKPVEVGRIDGLFCTVFEAASGMYQYLVAAVDSAGNEGPAAVVLASVQEPPDYVLVTDHKSQLDGRLVNCWDDSDYLLFMDRASDYGGTTTNARKGGMC